MAYRSTSSPRSFSMFANRVKVYGDGLETRWEFGGCCVAITMFAVVEVSKFENCGPAVRRRKILATFKASRVFVLNI